MSSGKNDKYEYLMGNQVSLFAFRKTLEKQTKTIEGQGKKSNQKQSWKTTLRHILKINHFFV